MFGNQLKKLRESTGMGLREFCRDRDLDAGYYSRMENGRFIPATDEAMDKLRNAFRLSDGDIAWKDVLTAAAIDRGELPKWVVSQDAARAAMFDLFRAIEDNDSPTACVRAISYGLRQQLSGASAAEEEAVAF